MRAVDATGQREVRDLPPDVERGVFVEAVVNVTQPYPRGLVPFLLRAAAIAATF